MTDPVCAMEVDPGHPGANLEWAGRTLLFCSEGCRERFQRDPERYLGAAGPTATDPVCGMELDAAAVAASSTHGGRNWDFCSLACRDRFLERPEAYSAMQTLAVPEVAPELPVDPICGMTVDPNDPGAILDGPEGTIYFCCQPCADQYAATRQLGR